MGLLYNPEVDEKRDQNRAENVGEKIIGFGSYHYKYGSGREGEWFLAGFSPRKANLTLYIMSGFTLRRTAGEIRRAQNRQVVPLSQQARGCEFRRSQRND
jgi:hypothetical protein